MSDTQPIPWHKEYSARQLPHMEDLFYWTSQGQLNLGFPEILISFITDATRNGVAAFSASEDAEGEIIMNDAYVVITPETLPALLPLFASKLEGTDAGTNPLVALYDEAYNGLMAPMVISPRYDRNIRSFIDNEGDLGLILQISPALLGYWFGGDQESPIDDLPPNEELAIAFRTIQNANANSLKQLSTNPQYARPLEVRYGQLSELYNNSRPLDINTLPRDWAGFIIDPLPEVQEGFSTAQDPGITENIHVPDWLGIQFEGISSVINPSHDETGPSIVQLPRVPEGFSIPEMPPIGTMAFGLVLLFLAGLAVVKKKFN